MGFNSVAILGKRTMRYSIPHLQAAESGGKAPVVEIKNTLASEIGTKIKGNNAVSPDVLYYPLLLFHIMKCDCGTSNSMFMLCSNESGLVESSPT